MKNLETGSVLIISTIFLMAVSILVIGMMDLSMFSTMSNRYYKDYLKAFNVAEEKLIQTEEMVSILPDSEILKLRNIEILDDKNICGTTFYKINTEATQNATSVKLQSIFTKQNGKKNIQKKAVVFSNNRSLYM